MLFVVLYDRVDSMEKQGIEDMNRELMPTNFEFSANRNILGEEEQFKLGIQASGQVDGTSSRVYSNDLLNSISESHFDANSVNFK